MPNQYQEIMIMEQAYRKETVPGAIRSMEKMINAQVREKYQQDASDPVVPISEISMLELQMMLVQSASDLHERSCMILAGASGPFPKQERSVDANSVRGSIKATLQYLDFIRNNLHEISSIVGAIVLCIILSPVAIAQASPTPSNPQQAEIQKRADLLGAQSELLYEKLHGLSEFQDFLKIQQELGTLKQQYQAAGAQASHAQGRPIPPVPTNTPVAPVAPVKK